MPIGVRAHPPIADRGGPMNTMQTPQDPVNGRWRFGSRVSRCVGPACLAAVLVSGSPAFADPVRLITVGMFGSGGDDTGFWAAGSSFYVQTAARPGADPVVTCQPCTPGTSLDLSSTVTIGDWGPGSATVDGQTYRDVYYSGSLTFTAGSVIVPDVQPQPDGLDYTTTVGAYAPFAF